MAMAAHYIYYLLWRHETFYESETRKLIHISSIGLSSICNKLSVSYGSHEYMSAFNSPGIIL